MTITRRAILALASASLISSGKDSKYSVLAAAKGSELDRASDPDSIITLGFFEPGDGGGGLYRRVATEPSHNGKLLASNGSWYELKEQNVRPEMFGARGDGGDDQSALQSALNYVVARGGRLELTARRYVLKGHLSINANARGFTILGVGRCRLEQAEDNCSHFYFSGENSAHWTIRGIEFAWVRDQTAAHPLSYAIRFDTKTNHNAGHRNFEVADCEFINGWRGIGVTPQLKAGLRCPVWGATVRNIRCSERHSGALVFLDGYGVTGQPNIALEQIYVRGDSMTEAAIRLAGCDSVGIRGIEFNLTNHACIEALYCRIVLITCIRFERCKLSRPGGAMVIAEGSSTRVVIDGLTIQNCATVAEVVSFAALSRRYATILIHDPVTAEDRLFDKACPLLLAGTRDGGTVELDGVSQCAVPSIYFAAAADTGVTLSVSEIMRLTLAQGNNKVLVARPGMLSEIWLSSSTDDRSEAKMTLLFEHGDDARPFSLSLISDLNTPTSHSRLLQPGKLVPVWPGNWLNIRLEGINSGLVTAVLVTALR